MKTILPVKFESVGLEDYRPFHCIERTIHFDDFTNKNDNIFNTSQISRRDNSFLSKDVKVLWFKPSTPDNENHFYGNISFCIGINELLQHFCSKLGYKLYWIETVIWGKSYDSRVMLTKRNLLNNKNTWDEAFDTGVFYESQDILHDMNCPTNEIGYPIYQDKLGKFYQLTKLDESKYTHKIHEVEFLIEVTGKDCMWLRENCDCRPVDHSKANMKLKSGKYVPRSCHKYNSMQKQDCLTPYTMRGTEQIMKDIDLRKMILRQPCSSADHWPQDYLGDIQEDFPRRIPEYGSRQFGNYSYPEPSNLRLERDSRMTYMSDYDHYENSGCNDYYNYHDYDAYKYHSQHPIEMDVPHMRQHPLTSQHYNSVYNGGRYGPPV